ncbi:DUF6199 family natural product biosynthesis protein [Paenibacillus puldeungensis]|uniref:DUF6199 family natural product biosynthesis protein n=2 Tax=Paenibacillus puldeungensis TaxID=696536 RepID=A0ABW3RYP7_9BACL
MFLIIMGVLIIALGILSIKKPTWGWHINEGWKVKGESEPSDAYIDSMKFSGTITVFVGSFFIIGGILSLL